MATNPNQIQISQAQVTGLETRLETIEASSASDPQLTSVAALTYTGNALKVIRVNAGETGFELATVTSGGGTGTTTNAVTFNTSGSGATSPVTFDGSAAKTISYNSIGAQPLNTQLTALAGVTWGSGTQVLTLTGANAFTLKTVGSATGNILDKAAADSLYQPVGTYAGTATFTASTDGLVPHPTTSTGKFLKDDGSWGTAAGSSTVWGGITGTLSNQTDLQTALNGKVSTGLATSSGLTATSGHVLGRATAGTGAIEEFTFTGLTASLDTFGTSTKGLVPSPGTVLNKFLRDDGSWQAIGSGTGTVTNFAFTNANGITGTVTSATTTPTLSLSLGAITPTSVTASGIVQGNQVNVTSTASAAIDFTTSSQLGTISLNNASGSMFLINSTAGDMYLQPFTGAVHFWKGDGTNTPMLELTSGGQLQLTSTLKLKSFTAAAAPTASAAGAGSMYYQTDGTAGLYLSNGTSYSIVSSSATIADGDKGDISVSGGVWTIDPQTVDVTKMGNITSFSVVGNNTGTTGAPQCLGGTALTTMISNFVQDTGTGGVKGLVPPPAAGDGAAGKFLAAQGFWKVPPFVSSVAATVTQGVTATVTNPTTTASIAIGLGAITPTSVSSTGSILHTSTAGIGYGTGAGGTVTQATSRTTGVTLSKLSGAITLFSTTTTAGLVTSFTVTNTLVAATDTVEVCVKSATAGIYFTSVTAVAAGSFRISVYTPAAVGTAEAPVLNFNVIKGVAA